MSRLAKFISKTNFFGGKLRLNLSLDFGSSQTRLMLGQELVWDQPTLLAWHNQLQTVVAIGDRAAALRGKTPAQVELISPIKKGVIAELDFAYYYLKAMFEQLRQQQKISAWVTAHCCVAYPAGSSPLEKKQLQHTLDRVGLKLDKLISKTEAVVSLTPFKKITQSHGVIDFGAETVDLGIFVGSQLFKSQTFNSIAGNSFTKLVIDQTLSEYQLQISWGVAEQIKRRLLAGSLDFENKKSSIMTIRGKDVMTQLIKVVRIESKIFRTAFFELAQALLAELKIVVDGLPPEVATQLQEQGFYLTGGSSQLLDWSALMKESWQISAIISDSPELDVVKGLTGNDK